MATTINTTKYAVTVVDNAINVVTIATQGPAGAGVIAGGTAGQFLTKTSASDFDTQWTSTSATVSSLNDILDVDVSGVVDGQLLSWDNANSEWVAVNVAAASWGTITGTLSSQLDLNTALGDKLDASVYTSHAADAAIHYNMSAISITESQISDLGSYAVASHNHTGVYEPLNANIQAHIADGTLHFTMASISITESQISDLGSYAVASHNHTGVYEPLNANIQAHIADNLRHFLMSAININEAQISDLQSYALATHNHTGVYEPLNANIQTHIADTANPHNTSVANLDGNVISGLATNDVLSYDGTNWINTPAAATADNWMHANAGSNFGTTPNTTINGIAIGNNARAEGLCCNISIGGSTLIDSGRENIALGWLATVTGLSSMQTYSSAIGSRINVTHRESAVIGAWGESTAENQVILQMNDSADVEYTRVITGNRGNLSIAGSRAQFIQPSYADGSEPTGMDGGTIYDSTNNVLKFYNGTAWTSIISGISDHTLLSNIGTNTHAQIDTHIADGTLHFTMASISITESQISDLGSYAVASHNHDADYAPLVHTHVKADITDADWISNITAEDLSDLNDVNASSPLNGQVLTWVNASSEYQALTPVTGVVDHTLLSNIGSNTHVQLDAHLNDTDIHYPMASISITESQISDLGTYETAFSKNTGFNLNLGTGSGTVSEGNHNHTGAYEPLNANIQTHIADGTLHFTMASISITESQISDLGSYAVASHNHDADYEPLNANIQTHIADTANPHDTSIANLDGNVISGLATNDVLSYDGTNWVNAVPAAGGGSSTPDVSTKTADYTVVLTDANDYVRFDSGDDLIVTIPLNATEAFAIGDAIDFSTVGLGALKVISISGVTLNLPNGTRDCAVKGRFKAIKVATDEWDIIGGSLYEPYDVGKLGGSKHVSVQAQSGTPRGIAWSNDGMFFFLAGYGSSIYTYSVDIPFDIDSSFTNILTTPAPNSFVSDIDWSNDGFTIYSLHINADTIYSRNVTTKYDLSTLTGAWVSLATGSFESIPHSISVMDDGVDIYVVGASGDDVTRLTMSTPHNISSATVVPGVIDVPQSETLLVLLYVSPDGKYVLTGGQTRDTIYRYTLSTPRDLTTAKFSGQTHTMLGYSISSFGITGHPNGSKMWMTGTDQDSVFELTFL